MEAWKIGLLIVLIAVLVYSIYYATGNVTITSVSDASGNKFNQYKTTKPYGHVTRYGDGYYL